MSTQPFGQQPAFGANPAPAAAPLAEEPKKSGRTVVIAVAAGVVALGVLGGAAALVLTSGDGGSAETALPAASAAPVEPTQSGTSAPETPLPTAVVQGRNVFVPLVEESVEAGAGGATDPVAAAPTAAPTTAAPTVAPLPLPAPTVTVTASDDELVAGLQAQIAALEAQLAATDDGSATIAALQAQIAALQAQLDEAEGGTAYDATVRLVSVNPDADSELLSLLVNGQDVKLDLDAGDPTFDASTVIHTTETDVDISLTYVDYVSATKIVTFTIGSESFQATLGTTLVYNF